MNSRLDLLVTNGEVITPDGVRQADVAVADGRIVRVAESITGAAARIVDASGLDVFPGILDAHVHFNEPGRTNWEGLASGSAALAAGGGTWFADMPLNSSPPVLDAAAFMEKRRLAEQKSVTDFSLWGGLVPGNIDRLEELRDAGAIGIKAFMCDSGLPEFPPVDAETLRAGMKVAAALGMVVAVHAESPDLFASKMSVLTRMAREAYTGPRPVDAELWSRSRPVEAELAAIGTAIGLSRETGCALHIVHVSSPEGVELIAEAKRNGGDVSAETCPHYLLLDETDLNRLRAPAKCAPPLRPAAMREALWEALDRGSVDTIGSDHSPSPPAMKASSDIFAAWGGISGCQHGFPLLLSEALERDGVRALPPSGYVARALMPFAALMAENVARRFRLPRKGRIEEGFDADFSLLNLLVPHSLNNAGLLYRHRQGPYHDRFCTVRVEQTFVRGKRIWSEGRIAPDAPRGRFIAPSS